MTIPLNRLARLGRRYGEQQDPELCLRHCISKVCELLPTEHAAIYLRNNEKRFMIAATSSGYFPKFILQYPDRNLGLYFPIGSSESPIGFLVISSNTLGPIQNRVLVRFVTDILPAARNAALVHQLRESRNMLVLTREEERRRLRRNLHNSIGPTLAALNLHVRLVEDLVRANSIDAQTELALIRRMTSNVIMDIRRVIYGLRPPALDELGLIEAIRTQAIVFQSDALEIGLKLPAALPSIPAAAEVAAYRIVQEALANITNHANARKCVIQIEFATDTIRLVVEDDGIGTQIPIRAGVGIMSMRELANELGGTCEIGRSDMGGLKVSAWLPCYRYEIDEPSEHEN
jgi:two-component system NarL family sensor kinase